MNFTICLQFYVLKLRKFLETYLFMILHVHVMRNWYTVCLIPISQTNEVLYIKLGILTYIEYQRI